MIILLKLIKQIFIKIKDRLSEGMGGNLDVMLKIRSIIGDGDIYGLIDDGFIYCLNEVFVYFDDLKKKFIEI